jgi:hypothetical protein
MDHNQAHHYNYLQYKFLHKLHPLLPQNHLLEVA